jgi:hypothetical protein
MERLWVVVFGKLWQQILEAGWLFFPNDFIFPQFSWANPVGVVGYLQGKKLKK